MIQSIESDSALIPDFKEVFKRLGLAGAGVVTGVIKSADFLPQNYVAAILAAIPAGVAILMAVRQLDILSGTPDKEGGPANPEN